MLQTLDSVWISSIQHLNLFSRISPPGSWWRSMLNLNKIPADFPQVNLRARTVPVVFFSKGFLRIFERQLDFHPNSFDSNDPKEYQNLKGNFQFELEYKSIRIERYEHPKPFLRFFSIPWIRLSSNDHLFDDILISTAGTKMNKIRSGNTELFEILRAKVAR